MIFVLRHNSIGEPSCLRLVKCFKKNGIDAMAGNSCYGNYNMIIHWGNCFGGTGKGIIEIGNRIKGGINKARTRKILQDAGISVPKSYFSKKEVLERGEGLYPILGRNSTVHTQGSGMFILNTIRDVKEHQEMAYYSEFIPKEHEYRVYLIMGKPIGIAEKIPKNKSDVAWNSHRGAEFVDLNMKDSKYKKIIDEAVKAIKVVYREISGIDIMTYKGKPYILEFNSAPSLSSKYRVKIFCNEFLKIYNENFSS